MHYWVYVHTCKDNGKRYVGCTTRVKPEYRWQEGRGYKTNKHFYSAILKHGWSNFEHEAWELTCESEMYYAEKYLIAYYHTTESEFGYNHSSGGEKSALGCTRSKEVRKKLSESAKKRCLDPEYRRKQSESHKGKPRKPHKEETKRKMSEIQKKIHNDPEYIKKQSEALKKSHSDPEFRKRQSKAQKKKWLDPEYRRKQVEAAKNRPKPRRVKIKLPDGTIIETTKNLIVRNYVNKGKKFEYVD